MTEFYDHPAAMEPMMPDEGHAELQGLAIALLQKSSALGSAVHPITRTGIVALVRNMNSYYSNLIEGHNTHPADIEKAMRQDFSADPARRALQIESRAHVEVQLLIEQKLSEADVCSPDFLCWIHKELYDRFPDDFRHAKTSSGRDERVIPGQLRACEVEVGTHKAPAYCSLPVMLSRFREAYQPGRFNSASLIVAAAASHHRLTWIHPFLDGNGRVVRLFTHAYLKKAKIDGHDLWMASRGLARRREEYLRALALADQPRRSDLDGRGNLSHEAFVNFCRFFLESATDQVDFMRGLLELDGMQHRIAAFAARKAALEGLPPETGRLLSDCFLRGEISRGEAARILRKPERTARRVTGRLLADGLLTSEGPKKPLRMGFPSHAIGYYFPRLYPESVEVT